MMYRDSNSALVVEQYQPKVPEPEPVIEPTPEPVEEECEEPPRQQQDDDKTAIQVEETVAPIQEAQPRKPSKSGPEVRTARHWDVIMYNIYRYFIVRVRI